MFSYSSYANAYVARVNQALAGPDYNHGRSGICEGPRKQFYKENGITKATHALNTAVAIYESMIEFMGKLRTRFEEFEEKGKKLMQ